MIRQIANVQTKTQPLPGLNKGLLKVRYLQNHVRETGTLVKPHDGQFWSPITAGPYLVPVSRWIE